MRHSAEDGSAGESENSEVSVGNELRQLVSSGNHDKSVAGDIDDDVTGPYNYGFTGDDYLELNDLQSLVGTSSASSDNSSRASVNSDECFDADALLKEIENDGLRMQEHVDRNSSIVASIEANQTRPNQVIITMPPSGTILSNENTAGKGKSASTSRSANMSILRSMSEGSFADQSVNSSNSTRSSNQGSPKSISKIAKLGKKYCCFGSF